MTVFTNLVVSLFFSPRKCLIAETVVFIHHLPIPFKKKNLLPTLKMFCISEYGTAVTIR